MKRQFASYVKLQLHSAGSPSTSGAANQHGGIGYESGLPPSAQPAKPTLAYYRTLSAGSSSNTSNSTSPTEAQPKPAQTAGSDFYEGTSGFLRRYAAAGASGMTSGPPNVHLLTGMDRRHRSPDPPPRYNRGQSPLLLRKQLLELSGQPPGGSPLLNRRWVTQILSALYVILIIVFLFYTYSYVNASPPLPPPRRGSESVPGSPQHFRTRIHYTPEPQRRIYRTIDQWVALQIMLMWYWYGFEENACDAGDSGGGGVNSNSVGGARMRESTQDDTVLVAAPSTTRRLPTRLAVGSSGDALHTQLARGAPPITTSPTVDRMTASDVADVLARERDFWRLRRDE